MAEETGRDKPAGSDLQPDNSQSKFRIYALGTVAADLPMKDLDEDPNQTLEVFLDEIFSFADGKIEAKGQLNEVTGTDGQGREYQAKAATTTSTPCFWLPFGTNRLTAPCMRKGMRVVLWRTSDEEQLYWEPKGGDDYLMTVERVVYTFQANPDPKDNSKKVDVNKCWYWEIDTARKRFVFGNSQANGELTRFFAELDLSAGKGYLRFAETSEETMLLLHFMDHVLRYQNKDGTIFDINKENVQVQCEDSITLVAKNNINLKSKQFNMECETANFKMQQWNAQVSGSTRFKTPLAVFTGSVQFTGEDGNVVELSGDFRHKTGTWTSPSGTNVYVHDHGGVERGGGKTDPFR